LSIISSMSLILGCRVTVSGFNDLLIISEQASRNISLRLLQLENDYWGRTDWLEEPQPMDRVPNLGEPKIFQVPLRRLQYGHIGHGTQVK
jgi:hypothetical protein